jgi:SAM-dependent methyltransferase
MIERLLHTVVAAPAVYDLLQRALGANTSLEKIRALASDAADASVLDVGGGTGNGLRALPAGARYIWLDNDPRKLDGLRANAGTGVLALLGSATAIPLASKSVDFALCLAMSHHLDDGGVRSLFAELGRVCRRRLVFVDPVKTDALISRMLWKYDRGSHPRRAETLRTMARAHFDLEHDEEYVIYHRYWLCAARPR